MEGKKDEVRGRGERKERKEEDRGGREDGEETRQRRNSCCYLSADDLKRGRATDTRLPGQH